MTIRKLKREIDSVTNVLIYHCTSEFLKNDETSVEKQMALLNEILNTQNAMRIKCNSYPKEKTRAHFVEVSKEFQGAIDAFSAQIKELER